MVFTEYLFLLNTCGSG